MKPIRARKPSTSFFTLRERSSLSATAATIAKTAKNGCRRNSAIRFSTNKLVELKEDCDPKRCRHSAPEEVKLL